MPGVCYTDSLCSEMVRQRLESLSVRSSSLSHDLASMRQTLDFTAANLSTMNRGFETLMTRATPPLSGFQCSSPPDSDVFQEITSLATLHKSCNAQQAQSMGLIMQELQALQQRSESAVQSANHVEDVRDSIARDVEATRFRVAQIANPCSRSGAGLQLARLSRPKRDFHCSSFHHG